MQKALEEPLTQKSLRASEVMALTLKAVRLSIILVTLSSLMVSVKAGQGDEWANLARLENSGWLHWEHTYIPAGGEV